MPKKRFNKYSQFHIQKKTIRQDKRQYKDPSKQVKITEFYDFLTQELTSIFIYRSIRGFYHGFKRRYDASTPYSREESHKNFMLKGKGYGEYLEYEDYRTQIFQEWIKTKLLQ